MQQERLGDLDVRITGGLDGRGSGDGPVVILLHGFGASGDDLVVLGELLDLPPEVRFVFPEAPLELPGVFGPARAWWMLDLEALENDLISGRVRDRSAEVPEGLAPARDKLRRTLDAIQECLGVTGERVVLGGFSQGSMLSCDVALAPDRTTELPLAGLVLLSTTLLCADSWVPGMADRAGLPVFQSHGRSDQLLPFSVAERMRDLMSDAGMDVTWQPFDGAHEIPPPVLAELSGFLRRVLAL